MGLNIDNLVEASKQWNSILMSGSLTKDKLDQLKQLSKQYDLYDIHYKIKYPIKSKDVNFPYYTEVKDLIKINETRAKSGIYLLKPSVRDCMKCSSEFFSEGSHNRLCIKCSSAKSYKGSEINNDIC